jgi:hypothetical protein
MRKRVFLLTLSLVSVCACVKRMIGYECVGLSGCNMAPRYSGTVTLAEWSSGEDALFAEWRWDVHVKITEGHAQCSGSFNMTRISRSNFKEEVSGSLKGEGKFTINADSDGYRGSVRCPEGKGTSKYTDYHKDRTWSRRVTGLEAPDIPIAGETTNPNQLKGGFPDSLYRYDGAVPVYIRASWDLRGMSPCLDTGVGSVAVLLRPQRTSAQWPHTTNYSLDGQQIAELKRKEGRTSGGNEGLTRAILPELKLDPDWAPTRQQDGYCFWVDSITVQYKPIAVYIDKSYSPGSCEYRETFAHEMRHVEAANRIFTRFASKLVETLSKTSSNYPMKERAQPVVSVELAQDLAKLFAQDIREAAEPIIDEMRDSLKARYNELDTPEEYDAVHSRCDNWVP